MADKKQKLELTWIGKDDRPRLEPRILLEDPALSYAAKERVTDADIFDNRLIHGDNLLALRALEQEFTGKVKCVFIDPPYNTGSAFEHYDDGVEHSVWLSLMQARIEIIHRLLTPDGSLWITIDDNECHYLKVMCDGIFGRAHYVASMVWEKDSGRKNDTDVSSSHDYVLVYAKDRNIWRHKRNTLERSDEQLARYQNPDNDPRGPWRQGADGTAKSGGESLRYPIELPSGRVVLPPSGNYWRFSKRTFEAARAEDRVYFGKKGDSMPVIKKYVSEIREGVVPKTWWPAEEVGSNQEARRDHLRKLLPEVEPFATPKPERLLQRILQIATNPGDTVLDSFAGSGTTGAVALKMGRRFLMIELNRHCTTHLVPRLIKVVDGADPWGITQAVNWRGGGGFRFYRLAPSLLERDKWGNWVVNKEYNKEMLAEAMCKLEGFTYAPSAELFWDHGHNERDHIYVTTQNLGPEQLRAISDEVGDGRSLLICCGAFRCKADAFANLTLKKIPAALLTRCEWGKDDYSLNVQAVTGQDLEDTTQPPEAAPAGGAPQPTPQPKRRGRPKAPVPAQSLPLFVTPEGK
ncbi:MAG: site-specific DNA-methyltransferase [Myxococcota bacterium]